MIRNGLWGSLYFTAVFAIFGAGTTSAGGLSGPVVRLAMCEDVLAQCMSRVEVDFPRKELSEVACRDKRYSAEKQCNFLYSHCIEGPPVKRIKPVQPGKKKH